MPPIWLLKIILCLAVGGDLAFVREYWVATRGGWMHDPIGLTLMLKDLALLIVLGLIVLSVFFHLSRLTSESIAWVQDGLLLFIAGVFYWRTFVFHQERANIPPERTGADGRSDGDPADEPGGGGSDSA